jgi:hypothetical protein
VNVPFPRPVYVAGAAALTPFGPGWRGLAAHVAAGQRPPAPQVPALSVDDDPSEPRHRKMMSRAAYLAAVAVRAALREPGLSGLGVRPDEMGCYLGVGASGGEIGELEAMLRDSVEGGAFRLDRFGAAGLRAANPLFAFQLMNNFTLCHGAILAGLEGPNAAFFSRGAGTVQALREAAFAVAGGDAPAALAGGADSALYPVTAFELARAGAGASPSEGAALLALSARPVEATGVRLLAAEIAGGPPDVPLPGGPLPGLAVVSASDRDVRAALALAARPGAETLVLEDALGETLAAAPAIAWTVALDWLAARPQGRARVLSRGPDGELGVVDLAKGSA